MTHDNMRRAFYAGATAARAADLSAIKARMSDMNDDARTSIAKNHSTEHLVMMRAAMIQAYSAMEMLPLPEYKESEID